MLKIHHRHDWDLDVAGAREIQSKLAGFVSEEPMASQPKTVAGVDVSVRDNRVRAAVSVLALHNLSMVDQAVWDGPAAFPYVPGYLSFREIPPVLTALERLETWPDLFMTDSHGRAHPRRFGLACHLGVLLGVPTIGVAKKRLTGVHETPCDEKGCTVPLLDPKAEETIGAVVRTRRSVKPVFVSVGHLIALDQAIELTLKCAVKFKLPEPTRRAHLLSRDW